MSDELRALERMLSTPGALRRPGGADRVRAMARLEFWRLPFPRDIREHDLENARRRLILGNLSGLWDGLARCTEPSWNLAWGLPAPPWLVGALSETVAAFAPSDSRQRLAAELLETIGKAFPLRLFEELDPIVRRYLTTARIAKTGRHARWWVRWQRDLIDSERADAVEHLLGRVREESLEVLEALEGRPTVPEIEAEREWRRFLVYQLRWTDDRVAQLARAELDTPSFPVRRVQTIIESWGRVRRTTEREPWRYAVGPLAFLESTRQDRIRRRERPHAISQALSAAFAAWKELPASSRGLSRSRKPRG